MLPKRDKETELEVITEIESVECPFSDVWDSDNDSVSDEQENATGTNPCDPDTDNDTLSDFTEIYQTFTDPISNDSDKDGINDGLDPAPLNASHDLDKDGVLDQDDVDWSQDLWVNWTHNWDWRGGNITFRPERDHKLMFKKTLEENSSVNNRANEWNWPDETAWLHVSVDVDGTVYDRILYLDQIVEWEITAENGTLKFSMLAERLA